MKTIKVILIMVSFFSQIASANRFTLAHSVSLSGQYEDNIRFSGKDEEESVSAGDLGFYGSLSRSTPVSSLSLNTNIKSSSFTNSLYNINTQDLSLAYTRFIERGQWNIRTNVANQSDRQINLMLGGGDMPSRDYNVSSSGINFNFQKNLTELQSVYFDISMQSNDYDYSLRSDYDYWSGSLLWQFLKTERLQLQGRASYSDYKQHEKQSESFPIFNLPEPLPQIPFSQETEDLCRNNDLINFVETYGLLYCGYLSTQSFSQSDLGLQLGFTYILSEDTNIDFLVGRSQTENKSKQEIPYYYSTNSLLDNPNYEVINNTKGFSTIYQISFDKEFDKADLSLTASSSNKVGGDGEVRPTSQYSMFSRWKLNEFNSLAFRLSYLSLVDQSFSPQNNEEKRNIKNLMINYIYDLDKHWSIGINYFHVLRSSFDNTSRLNRSFIFSITWQPTEIEF